MFNLFLNGEELDINSGQSVDWKWTPLRFQDDLTDQYTTDFDLPRSRKNVKILKASGVLDSENRFSSKLEKVILMINGVILNAYMQVVSINDDTITVSVYEKYIPTDVLNMRMIDFIQDNKTTIYPWKEDSWTKYPDVYKKYMYGPFREFKYANYHQSRPINYILDGISLVSHYELPQTDSQLWATATGKNVCPQNTKQVIEVNFTNGEYGVINGGQHITNDVRWSWNPDSQTIEFNKQCNVSMEIWLSYSRSVIGVGSDDYFEVIVDTATPQTPTQDHITFMPTTQHYNDIVIDSWTVPNNYIVPETTMQFRISSPNAFRFVSAVISMTITDYDIIEDDYSIDMEYVYRNPKLRFRNYGDNTERYMEFNGTTQVYEPYSGHTQYQLYCPDLSFCHLGYWCNLPDITLKELLFGLEWLTKKRFVRDKWEYKWVDIDTKYQIEGEITEMEMSNDSLGQKNHLMFTGEKENDENTVTKIDNFWLESNATLHQSPFAYSSWRMGNLAYFEQYSEKVLDEDTGEHSAKYDEIDGLAVSKIVPSTPNLLLRVVLPDMDFDEVTQATTVTIETFDNVANADWVYLHGRKYMVQEIDTDIETGISTIKAIEIWRKNPAGLVNWPPEVNINEINNITGDSAQITFTITEN